MGCARFHLTLEPHLQKENQEATVGVRLAVTLDSDIIYICRSGPSSFTKLFFPPIKINELGVGVGGGVISYSW